MKLKHQLNANEFDKVLEVSNKPSLTIPDQSLSIRELYDRFSQGLPLQGAKEGVFYGEDEEFPDFQKMDLAEREDYIKGVREELQSIKDKRVAEIDRKRKEQAEKVFQKRLELEINRRKESRVQSEMFKEDNSGKSIS